MRIRNYCFFATVALLLAATAAEAQRQPLAARRSIYNRTRVSTPYFRNAYGNAYGRGISPYGVNPYVTGRAPVISTPALPPVTGPVERYSDVEYGDIVQMAIAAARANDPGGATTAPQESIVDETTTTVNGETAYKPVGTGVSDILDRGVFLLPTGEELRLRGVSMPSATDTNDVLRLYAKEGVQVLRKLTQGKEAYILLDSPLRDTDGRLLGTVMLGDGTDLNRRMLELGYGSLKENDFATGVDYKDLKTAQTSAQESRLGIWSRGF